jgi:hypothetical protein
MCWETLGTIFMVAAPVVSGIQANQQYQAEAKAAKQAAYDEEQAFAIRQKEREERQREQAGAVRARAGAAGIDPNAGSPLDVLTSNAAEFAKENFLDRFTTNRNVRSLKQSAKNLKQSGRNAVLGGFLQGAANWGRYQIKG